MTQKDPGLLEGGRGGLTQAVDCRRGLEILVAAVAGGAQVRELARLLEL